VAIKVKEKKHLVLLLVPGLVGDSLRLDGGAVAGGGGHMPAKEHIWNTPNTAAWHARQHTSRLDADLQVLQRDMARCGANNPKFE